MYDRISPWPIIPFPDNPNYGITGVGRVFRITPPRSGKNFSRPVPFEIHGWTGSNGKPCFAIPHKGTRNISLAKLMRITFGST